MDGNPTHAIRKRHMANTYLSSQIKLFCLFVYRKINTNDETGMLIEKKFVER